MVLEVFLRERERESGTRVLVEYILSCTIFEGEKTRIWTFVMIFNDYAIYFTPKIVGYIRGVAIGYR